MAKFTNYWFYKINANHIISFFLMNDMNIVFMLVIMLIYAAFFR